MEKSDKEYKYLKAKERVEKIKKFYNNLITYIIFIGFLAALNYFTNGWDNPWFLWAALGWGIGIVFHALKVFDYNPFFNKDWEERKLKEFMEKDTEITKRNTTKWK